MTTASRSLATALWKARFASRLLPIAVHLQIKLPSYHSCPNPDSGLKRNSIVNAGKVAVEAYTKATLRGRGDERLK